MASDVIKAICRCIEILVGENKQGVLLTSSTTEASVFLVHLRDNVGAMFSEVQAHPKLKELLRPYEKYVILENENYVHWHFVRWCLILINVLHDSLWSKTSCDKEMLRSDAASALSISQRKGVEKCLQFIIALGFLPNLLPGLGIPLRNRTEYGGIVAHVGKDLCPRSKYKFLVTSVAVILKCITHVELQSIIITRHTGDLLAALFQLCHAPIKKPKDQEFCSTSGKSGLASCSQATDVKSKKELPKDLITMLEEARDQLQWSENQLIAEMWEDRHNYLPHLEQLLQRICSQVLIWELFLLQGMSHKLLKQEKQHKTPFWLKKLCNKMLIEHLLKPHGLKLFICVMLDKVTDSDLKEGSVDKRKVEAVARLITSNPFQNMSLEYYIQNISAQIIDLIQSRESQVDHIYAYVACTAVLQFVDIDQHLAKQYIFQRIFKELSRCLDKAEISRYQEGDSIVKEDALNVCIESIYQIFVESGVSSSQHNAFDLLLPFYHLLFIMFSEAQKGVSFLCPKLKRLLILLLQSYSVDESVALLSLASFEDVTFHPVQRATDLKCVLGDSGGLVLVKNSNPRSEELFESINKKCAAVISVFGEISIKKLKVTYFLSLLKRRTDLIVSDEKFVHCEVTELRNSLALVLQLQEISGKVSEDLVEDIGEAVHFIKLALENDIMVQNSDNCESSILDSETLITSLLILNTIVEYKSKLSSSHWKAMKQCLPSLKKLTDYSNNALVKNMCENLYFAIATHGAASKAHGSKEQSVQNSDSTNISNFKKIFSAKRSTTSKTLTPVSPEMKHKATAETMLYENSCEISDCANKDHVTEVIQSKDSPQGGGSGSDNLRTSASTVLLQGCPSALNQENASPLLRSTSSSVGGYQGSPYDNALRDLNDPLLPVRGHGLITLTRLIKGKNEKTLAHKDDLLKIFLANLSDEDSYIYLTSIEGLSALADVSTELILPEVLKRFCSANNDNSEVQLKLGEVLLKICKSLGEMTVKYRNEFIHAYLCGTKHNRPEIRASSLSNLSEVCKCLKFSLQPFLQEILLCVLSLLKTDKDMEVRRSAALVLTSLLQGTGKDAFVVLENKMKELYQILRSIYHHEKDDVLKLHAQLAIEEINAIVKDAFCNKPTSFTKEIRVLDPF